MSDLYDSIGDAFRGLFGGIVSGINENVIVPISNAITGDNQIQSSNWYDGETILRKVDLTEMAVEGDAIPVIYGIKIVGGKVVFLGPGYRDAPYVVAGQNVITISTPLGANEWQVSACVVLGMGKLHLLYIYLGKASLNRTSTEITDDYNNGTQAYSPVNIQPSCDIYVSKLKGIAFVVFGDTYRDALTLDPSGKLPDLHFRVKSNLSAGAASVIGYEDVNRTTGDLAYCGCNPITVLYDMMTNPFINLGVDPADINTASFIAAAALFQTKLYGVNFVLTAMSDARTKIDTLLGTIGAILTTDVDQKYIVQPIDTSLVSTYAASLSDTAGDFSSFGCKRQTWSDVYNSFTAQWSAITDLETTRTVSVKNTLALSKVANVEKTLQVDLTMMRLGDVAARRLNEIMMYNSYPKLLLQFTTKKKYYFLNVGDIIYCTHVEYGFAGAFRIMSKTIKPAKEPTIEFTAMQAVESILDIDSYSVGTMPQGATAYTILPTPINLTFYAYTPNSILVHFPSAPTAKTTVVWGANQANNGVLKYTINNPPTGDDDFTFITSCTPGVYGVLLNATKWANTIQANTLGLLNVDVYI